VESRPYDQKVRAVLVLIPSRPQGLDQRFPTLSPAHATQSLSQHLASAQQSHILLAQVLHLTHFRRLRLEQVIQNRITLRPLTTRRDHRLDLVR